MLPNVHARLYFRLLQYHFINLTLDSLYCLVFKTNSTFVDKLTERVNVIYINQFDRLSSGKTRHLYRLRSSIWVFLKHSGRAFNMLKHFVPISAVLLQFLGCCPGKISADGQLGDVYSDGTK